MSAYTTGPWTACQHPEAQNSPDVAVYWIHTDSGSIAEVRAGSEEVVGSEAANARLIADAPILLEASKQAEEDLGNNIQWVLDQFDLQVRQGNPEVLHRTMALQRAWAVLAKAIAHAEGRT